MTTSNPPAKSRSGTFSHLAGMLGAGAQYVKTRLQLMGMEAKEAVAHYGVAAGMIAGALFVAILGYIFLVLTAVFGIAAACDATHAWIWVLGGAALIHLGGAVALALLARRRLQTGAFSLTLEEFKKDQACLTKLANNR